MPGQRFLDCLDAKVGLQRDRHPPGKDTAGEPVDDSGNSISVFSPLIADTAAFASNARLWFRRGRLEMVFSSLAASCCGCAENLLNKPVQFS